VNIHDFVHIDIRVKRTNNILVPQEVILVNGMPYADKMDSEAPPPYSTHPRPLEQVLSQNNARTGATRDINQG
jgi:hypothetical protein